MQVCRLERPRRVLFNPASGPDSSVWQRKQLDVQEKRRLGERRRQSLHIRSNVVNLIKWILVNLPGTKIYLEQPTYNRCWRNRT